MWIRIRIWLATQLLKGTGFGAQNLEARSQEYDTIVKARDLVLVSGHLSRAYRVGRKLRDLLQKAITYDRAAVQ